FTPHDCLEEGGSEDCFWLMAAYLKHKCGLLVRIVVGLSLCRVVEERPRENMAEAATELKLPGEVVCQKAVEFLTDESARRSGGNPRHNCTGGRVKRIMRISEPP